ncbi:MAG: PadR family transcriptional regulator [Gemmatimonadetes bacterium]|nr:PadR family transcriptional regulator [Gemmatimonadota bacterium]
MSQNSAEFIPLKPLVFHILLVLVSGERHGYSIVKEVAAQTEGQFKIEPGNLYRTLRTIAAQGLIVESARRPDPDLDDQRRRYFRVTPLGSEVLRAEALRMERLSLSAKAEFEAAGARGGER